MFDSVLRPDFSQTRLGTGVIVALATHAVAVTLALTLSGQTPRAKPVLDWPVVKIHSPAPAAQSGDSTQKPSVERRRNRRRDLVLPPREVQPQERVENPLGGNRIGDPQGQSMGRELGAPEGMPGGEPLDSSAALSAPPQRIELDERAVRLTKVSGPDPEYTQQAIDHEVEGIMLVKCIVTASGYVEHCRVLKSVQFMDRAVIDALERRRYKPYLSNGKPLEVDYTFKIKLNLPR